MRTVAHLCRENPGHDDVITARDPTWKERSPDPTLSGKCRQALKRGGRCAQHLVERGEERCKVNWQRKEMELEEGQHQEDVAQQERNVSEWSEYLTSSPAPVISRLLHPLRASCH